MFFKSAVAWWLVIHIHVEYLNFVTFLWEFRYRALRGPSGHRTLGVHTSFQPTSRAGSTWSKFKARGEHGERGEDGKHGDVLRFSTEVFSGYPTCVCSGSRRTMLQLRCAPVLQLGCAPVLGEPCSGSPRTSARFSENRAPCSYIC